MNPYTDVITTLVKGATSLSHYQSLHVNFCNLSCHFISKPLA